MRFNTQLLKKKHRVNLVYYLNQNILKQSNTTPIIVHWRGNHFYPDYYSRKARRSARKIHLLQEHKRLPRTGIYYSSATHEVAEVLLNMPLYSENEEKINDLKKASQKREKKLKEAHKKILKTMTSLQGTGPGLCRKFPLADIIITKVL